MTPTSLLFMIQRAHSLYALTHDPMIPSAIRLATDAYLDALTHDDPVPVLSVQQQHAVNFLTHMEDAHLTLFGEPVKPPKHERTDDPR